MTFQQKWIFLNKILHEMKIQFPSSDLVGKGGEAGGQRPLSSGCRGAGKCFFTSALTFPRSLTTELPFRGHR